VGDRDFRLPGLGAYLQEAASRGDMAAIAWGLGTLVSVIVVLDQLVWRPLLAWSTRFKLEMVAGAEAPSSWFYSVLRHSRLINAFQRMVRGGITGLDVALLQYFPPSGTPDERTRRPPWGAYAIGLLGGAALFYGLYRAGSMLLLVSTPQWRDIAVGVGATLLRVIAALVIALSWTLPLGVAIGTRPHLAARVQPLAQIAASIPATALFPVVVLVIAGLPAGMNLAAVLLMLMGTQWYLLFNVIAGASAIPQDLQYTAGLLQLGRWKRWRVLILPALFPYLITGAVTASGGAWNASIVAEYSDFAGHPRYITGVGALIAQATSSGTYPLLLAATLAMIGSVVTINRLVWRRLYRVAEARYRLE
jgi:NitT/TauT family transport system permease protein